MGRGQDENLRGGGGRVGGRSGGVEVVVGGSGEDVRGAASSGGEAASEGEELWELERAGRGGRAMGVREGNVGVGRGRGRGVARVGEEGDEFRVRAHRVHHRALAEGPRLRARLRAHRLETKRRPRRARGRDTRRRHEKQRERRRRGGGETRARARTHRGRGSEESGEGGRRASPCGAARLRWIVAKRRKVRENRRAPRATIVNAGRFRHDDGARQTGIS